MTSDPHCDCDGAGRILITTAVILHALLPVVVLAGSSCILTVQQLQHLGKQFLHSFITMKHNGAVDKTQSGFQALAAR